MVEEEETLGRGQGAQIQREKGDKCKKQERKIQKSGMVTGDEGLGRGLASPPRQRHWQTNKNPKGNKKYLEMKSKRGKNYKGTIKTEQFDQCWVLTVAKPIH